MTPATGAYETFSGDLRLFTIIGDPISQARSPYLVNTLLKERDLEKHLMVPLHVPSAGLAPVVAGLRPVRNFLGSIVTMPHKQSVIALLDRTLPEAGFVGACNIFRREADGSLVGTMLDGEGFVAGLVSQGHDPAGKRFFLAGAGGAASGIAHALAKHGARGLVIYNRSAARAAHLAEMVRSASPTFAVSATDQAAPGDFDIAINGTSLGMRDADPLPFDPSRLRHGALVADVVIRRGDTPILAEAARRGCRTHGGLHMLQAQIALMVDFMLGADTEEHAT